MIDYKEEEIKEKLETLSAETGMPIKDLIEQCEYFFSHRKYVRFVKGKYKGEVGVVYPDGEINPYAKDVHMPDGSVIWCPRYDTELIEITEDEYKEASNADSN